MPRRTDTSLASLLLTQRLVRTPAAPLTSTEYWPLLHQLGGDPAVLLGQDTESIARVFGVAPPLARRVTRLLDAAVAFAFALEDAEQGGLQVLAAGDKDYPRQLTDRLGHRAPPVLYAYGDTALLAGGLLGVVGSREVDDEAADVAKQAGEIAVAGGLGVVSGCARGADTWAMTGALTVGGQVVGIPATSLTQAARTRWRRPILDGRTCLISPYGPDTSFSAARAHGRNPLIYALSQATLVVAADAGKGGTWHGAVEALNRSIAPVMVWCGVGSKAGNGLLVDRGGLRVNRLADVAFPGGLRAAAAVGG